MQTANGKVEAQIGVLSSLWLGKTRIEQVHTAFLEDEKLGSNGLLGMSVLGRYKLTVDDANAIILSGKETDPRLGGFRPTCAPRSAAGR